jgi:hypothetical protein
VVYSRRGLAPQFELVLVIGRQSVVLWKRLRVGWVRRGRLVGWVCVGGREMLGVGWVRRGRLVGWVSVGGREMLGVGWVRRGRLVGWVSVGGREMLAASVVEKEVG